MCTLFETEMVAVKPLPSPAGLVFYLRFKYAATGERLKNQLQLEKRLQITKEVDELYKDRVSAYRDVDDSWYTYCEGQI